MNATLATGARAVGLALILTAAAAVGILTGNLIQGRADNNAGYPEGWQGGAAVPVSRTATAAFSLDAIADLQAARGDAPAETEEYVDYAQRHADVSAPAKKETKESLARPTLR
ncbi:MAG: hypothetical protein M3Y29_07270 [Chloroflexota bacterium]|jgi:hypothetical protein|nr:hypothetical protein [Chloroflexota bacterium]